MYLSDCKFLVIDEADTMLQPRLGADRTSSQQVVDFIRSHTKDDAPEFDDDNSTDVNWRRSIRRLDSQSSLATDVMRIVEPMIQQLRANPHQQTEAMTQTNFDHRLTHPPQFIFCTATATETFRHTLDRMFVGVPLSRAITAQTLHRIPEQLRLCWFWLAGVKQRTSDMPSVTVIDRIWALKHLWVSLLRSDLKNSLHRLSTALNQQPQLTLRSLLDDDDDPIDSSQPTSSSTTSNAKHNQILHPGRVASATQSPIHTEPSSPALPALLTSLLASLPRSIIFCSSIQACRAVDYAIQEAVLNDGRRFIVRSMQELVSICQRDPQRALSYLHIDQPADSIASIQWQESDTVWVSEVLMNFERDATALVASFHGEIPPRLRARNFLRFISAVPQQQQQQSSSVSLDESAGLSQSVLVPPALTLVSTDIAARGLDFESFNLRGGAADLAVSRVIQFDFPKSGNDFLHRSVPGTLFSSSPLSIH